MATAATIGQLLIDLILNDKEFAKSLDTDEAKLAATGKSMASAAAVFSTAATVAFTAATAAATAFAVGTIKAGSDFQLSMATLGAVANDGSLNFQADLEAMREQSLLLGRTTLFGAKQAADGLAELVKAGFSSKQAIEASDAVVALAGAHQLELGRASSIVAAALHQFGLEAAQAGMVTDVLSKGANISLASVDSLAEALKFAGPVAAGFGNDIQQTTAVLSAFTNLGIDAGLAGRALRSGLASVAQGTKEQTAALKEAGLTFDQVNPQVVKLDELLLNLSKSSITTTQAMTIFGTESGAAFASLASGIRAGTVDIAGIEDQLRKAAGSTAAVYQTQLNTVSGQTKLASNAIEQLFIQAFDGISGALPDLIARFTDFVNKATDSVKAHLPELEANFTQLFDVIGNFLDDGGPAFVEAMIGLTNAILPLITMLTNLVLKLTEVSAALYSISVFRGVEVVFDAINGTESHSVVISRDHAKAVQQLTVEINANQAAIDKLNASLAAGTNIRAPSAIKEEIADIEARNTALQTSIAINQKAIDREESAYSLSRLTAKGKKEIADKQAKADAVAADAAKKKDDQEKANAKTLAKLMAAQEALVTAEGKSASIAEDLAKLTQGPLDALEIATRRTIDEVNLAYDKAVAAAQKAGLDTIAIEQERQQTLTDIAAKAAKDREDIERDAAIKSASMSLDVQRAATDAYEAGLSDYERIKQGEVLAAARTAQDIQAIAIKLAQDLSGLTASQTNERVALEQKAAQDIAAAQAQGAKDVIAAQKAVEADALHTADVQLASQEAILEAYESGLTKRQARRQADTLAEQHAAIDKEQIANDLKESLLGLEDQEGTEAVALRAQAAAKIKAIDAQLYDDTHTSFAEAMGNIRDVAIKVVGEVKAAVSAMSDAINGALGKLGSLVETLSGASVSLKDLVTAAGTTGQEGGGAAGIEATATAGVDFATSVAENFDVVVQAAVDGIPKVISAVAASIGPVVDALVAAMPQIITALADGMVDVAKALADKAPELVQSIVDNLDTLVIAIIQAAKVLIIAIIRALPDLINSIVDQIPTIVQALANSVGVVIKVLLKSLPDIIIALVNAIPVVVNALVHAVPTIITAVIEGLLGPNGLYYRIPEIALALVEAVLKVMWMIEVKLPIQIVKGVVDAMPQVAAGLWKALTVDLPAFITGAVADFFEKIWDGFIDIAETVGQIILEAITFGLAGSTKNEKVGLGDVLAEVFTLGFAKTDIGLGKNSASGSSTSNSMFASGIKFVPRAMLAQIDPGEAIIPADQNPFNPGISGGSNTSSGGGTRSMASSGNTTTSLQVLIDGKVVDGAIVRSKGRGQMPALSKMLRKASGIKTGLDRRNFSSFVS